jgi:hypothetical protein
MILPLLKPNLIQIKYISDTNAFSQFELYANDVARSSQALARSKYEVAESLGLSTTSVALDKNQVFPFVTLPDFEVQGSSARELSDTDLIVFCPLVYRGEQEKSWGNYSIANQGWLREALDYAGEPDVDPGPIPESIHDTRDFSDPSYNDGLHPELLDRMAPLW